MSTKKSSPNFLQTPEQVFNYLKRSKDFELNQILEQSEVKTWLELKTEMLSDNDWIIYLETRKEKINTERKTKNYVNKASGNANFAKAGTQNLKKLTSDPKHQRKAGVKGAEAMRKINSQRLKDLLLYSLEVLPLEFTSDDLLSLYNNNQQNTLFHKSHKLNKPISKQALKRWFSDKYLKSQYKVVPSSFDVNESEDEFNVEAPKEWNVTELTVGDTITSNMIKDSDLFGWKKDGTDYKVVIVQPNIDPYNEKFALNSSVETQLSKFFKLADKKYASDVDLLLGPETAISAGFVESNILNESFFQYLSLKGNKWKKQITEK